MGISILAGGLLVLEILAAGPAAAHDEYFNATQAWRKQRERDLLAEEGWLTLVGLHWLESGDTPIGSQIDKGIRLPDTAPPRVGVLHLDGDQVSFRTAPELAITLHGEPFSEGVLRSDAQGKPDVLGVGSFRLMVLRRGERFALRIKDNQSPARTQFTGLSWLPIDPKWRVEAHFEPAAIPTRLEIDTIVGTHESLESTGEAVFVWEGKEYRLQAAREGDHLWFVFADGTSGRTTAPNGRQLLADPPRPDGRITLDFNRAVNLPCAYTTFATCPLPPRPNRLELSIPAGEGFYQAAPAHTGSR
jgi:uncharacterized protein (DUF1684 family)